MAEQTGVLAKIRKMKERPPEKGGRREFSSFRNLFHNWHDGDNIVRLLGEFVEVRTHYIAPVPKRKDRGLCKADAFQGENHLPATINCPDWDVEKEESKPTKTCPICRLAAIARAALKDKESKPTADEKKFLETLRNAAFQRTGLKWNLFDREDPFITKKDGENEVKVKGAKIGTLGPDAWKDVDGIFTQCQCDITDPVEGIDICVTKTVGNKTGYSAKAVLEKNKTTGKMEVKVTPLTDEEKAIPLHDLKVICGKQTDMQKVIDALHDDLRELLEANLDADTSTDAAPEGEGTAAPVEDAVPGGDDEDAVPGGDDEPAAKPTTKPAPTGGSGKGNPR